jgi:hypothetical protein
VERAFTWTILAFCVAYALDATTIDMRLGQQISAAAFPLAAAVFTAVSSVMLLVSSRRARDHDRPADIGRTEILFTAMGFAYWLSLPWLGYVVATSLFLSASPSRCVRSRSRLARRRPSGSCSCSCSACHFQIRHSVSADDT